MKEIQQDKPTRPMPQPGHSARPDARRSSVNEVMHMRATLGIFRRHLWAFMTIAVLVPACAWVAIQRTTPRYTATGSLLYEPSEYKGRELESMLRTDPTTEAVMASQAEILQSLKIAQRVAERGHLYDNPEFNPPPRTRSLLGHLVSWIGSLLRPAPPELDRTFGPLPDPGRNATVLAVHDVLHAAPLRFSRVLEVTFTAEDPLVAAAGVNNAMDIYIKDQFTAKAAAMHRATQWLDERAGALRAEVRTEEDRIAAYRAQHNFAQGMHAGLDAEKISHLNEDLIRARAELAAADARLDAARGRAGAAAQAAISASVVPLRTNLEQLTAQYQAQGSRLGANHPEAESSRRQVDDARRSVEAEIGRVVTGTDQDRRAAKERVTALERNLHDAQTDADEEAKARIPLNAMERDAEASRAQLLLMLERIQQTAQQHALETSEAHEISLALPPRQPSWPKPAPMMAAGVAAGMLLGLMVVHFLHLTDTTLNSGEDVRTISNRPCFALLPELSRRELRSASIDEFVIRRPLTAFAEQIRAVRAGLWMGTDRPKVVAITAARPAEGKSVLALSLARSASLSGEKVLLIDCDIRRPSLAHRLRADNDTGLSDLLRGTAQLKDVLHGDRFGGPGGGMHFVPAGKAGGDSFGLFMGPEMARLLTEARREYALIVLDTPPIQAITEARVLAAVADATILCVRWRTTPKDVVVHALELLEDAHAQVVGTVLTRVDPRAHVRSGYADAEVYHRRYKAYFSG
jgi:polysaccharide biosynthesis transport protein